MVITDHAEDPKRSHRNYFEVMVINDLALFNFFSRVEGAIKRGQAEDTTSRIDNYSCLINFKYQHSNNQTKT